MFAAAGNDLEIYEKHAADWWNPASPYFRSLQHMTPFRMGLIDKWFGDVRGKKIVDCGCGGGLLSLPLLARGADVTGVDRSPASIREAERQARGEGKFICADILNMPLEPESADMALLADVIDHVPEYPRVLQSIHRILRPGGLLFVSTINRTFRSWLFAIVLGEGLGLIPRGTHAHRLFVTPRELTDAGREAGFLVRSSTGDSINIRATIRDWAISMREGKNYSVSYSMLFEKV